MNKNDMIENIKKISNPLTTIAIFAGLAEINSTIAISYVRADLQNLYSGDGIPLFWSMVTPLKRRPKRERAFEGFKDRV